MDTEKYNMAKEFLDKIYGEDNYVSDPELLLAYSQDIFFKDGNAKFVVFPETISQLRRLIIFSNKNNINLVPRGGGSNFVGGCVPNNAIVVDMKKLIKVYSYDKSEQSIWVEPGVILSKLNYSLNNHNLFFPVIPFSEDICTLGGMVATNAFGLYSFKYGRTVDNVEEIHFLDFNGVLQKSKDKNIVGSEGIIGFIVAIKLKLQILPVEKSLTLYSFSDYEEVSELVSTLKQDKHILFIKLLDKQTSKKYNLDNKFHLIVEYNDLSGDLKTDEDKNEVYKILSQTIDDYLLGGYLMEDPLILQNSYKKIIEWCNLYDVLFFADLGIGIFHIFFDDKNKSLSTKLYELILENDCKICGGYGIGLRKKNYISNHQKKVFFEMKKKYDPNNIFNRGKIIGNDNTDFN